MPDSNLFTDARLGEAVGNLRQQQGITDEMLDKIGPQNAIALLQGMVPQAQQQMQGQGMAGLQSGQMDLAQAMALGVDPAQARLIMAQQAQQEAAATAQQQQGMASNAMRRFDSREEGFGVAELAQNFVPNPVIASLMKERAALEDEERSEKESLGISLLRTGQISGEQAMLEYGVGLDDVETVTDRTASKLKAQARQIFLQGGSVTEASQYFSASELETLIDIKNIPEQEREELRKRQALAAVTDNPAAQNAALAGATPAEIVAMGNTMLEEQASLALDPEAINNMSIPELQAVVLQFAQSNAEDKAFAKEFLMPMIHTKLRLNEAKKESPTEFIKDLKNTQSVVEVLSIPGAMNSAPVASALAMHVDKQMTETGKSQVDVESELAKETMLEKFDPAIIDVFDNLIATHNAKGSTDKTMRKFIEANPMAVKTILTSDTYSGEFLERLLTQKLGMTAFEILETMNEGIVKIGQQRIDRKRAIQAGATPTFADFEDLNLGGSQLVGG